MTRPLLRRLLILAALPVAACTLPSTSAPPRPAPAAPPPPVLASLAAFATVRFMDPGTRQAVLETSGGAVIDMTAAPQARNLGTLRPGARVVVEYDANGTVRIAPAARMARDAGGRTRATVREIAVGGSSMVLAGPGGGTQDVTLQNPPMMAFATRLRPGDEVAVRLEPAAGPAAAPE